ncbi:MAG: hypothetical protein FWC24_05975 [Treponema sp.]|nr:hypothetical protein [Treponema sp.]
MKKAALSEKIFVRPETLIGTKWVGVSEMFSGRLAMEFLDQTNCIYTSTPDKFEMKYTVTEGKIFIGDIEEPFELIGNVLFNGGIPVFEKAA